LKDLSGVLLEDGFSVSPGASMSLSSAFRSLITVSLTGAALVANACAADGGDLEYLRSDIVEKEREIQELRDALEEANENIRQANDNIEEAKFSVDLTCAEMAEALETLETVHEVTEP
jgi:peptidoglycan hydrolase CwlO-like protein